jgi:ribosomal protein S18 acetylase RimI-like enzyme
MMAGSEPWVTLGRDFEASLRQVTDPTREVYVADAGGELLGFVVVLMGGAFKGYVQTLCVAPAWRNRGVGRALLAFAEERILRESPNVFMCVSSFNHGARRLYERLGYEPVGELSDYLVAGHSEILLRKTTASWQDFERRARAGRA